mmetsp:Transcript_52370/g.137015  ORF Transcript_52370/g.137015 Transcript_52370/m.137015 type:complete len:294 (-) Transcript_52370:9459-10340(-)
MRIQLETIMLRHLSRGARVPVEGHRQVALAGAGQTELIEAVGEDLLIALQLGGGRKHSHESVHVEAVVAPGVGADDDARVGVVQTRLHDDAPLLLALEAVGLVHRQPLAVVEPVPVVVGVEVAFAPRRRERRPARGRCEGVVKLVVERAIAVDLAREDASAHRGVAAVLLNNQAHVARADRRREARLHLGVPIRVGLEHTTASNLLPGRSIITDDDGERADEPTNGAALRHHARDRHDFAGVHLQIGAVLRARVGVARDPPVLAVEPARSIACADLVAAPHGAVLVALVGDVD